VQEYIDKGKRGIGNCMKDQNFVPDDASGSWAADFDAAIWSTDLALLLKTIWKVWLSPLI